MKKMINDIEYILTNYPATRNSDRELIRQYFEFIGRGGLTVAEWSADSKLPTFDSITRARRKITEINPELRGCKKVEDARYRKQAEWIDFAREGA